MTNVSSGIRELLFKIAGEKHRNLVLIALSWKSIVGDILAERSKITKFENNILYVKTAHHVWCQEFILNRPTLLAKLREKTGLEIENILFTL